MTRSEQDPGAGATHRPRGEGFVHSPLGGAREPAGHGIRRSRGGLTTKTHAVVAGNGGRWLGSSRAGSATMVRC